MSPRGVTIHLCQDVDTPESNQPVFFEAATDRVFRAEGLCLEVAKRLKIGPKSFHCFALATPDMRLWLAPNEEIKCEPGVHKEYLFRVRFIPTEENLFNESLFDTAAYNYFFLQVRQDFVQDKWRYKLTEGKKISQGHLLGLAVIDVLRWGKERKMDLKQLQKNGSKTKKFIPNSEKGSFRMPWDMKRLNFNFNNNLATVYTECQHQDDGIIKKRYLRGFFSYVEQYGMEKFSACDGKVIGVDPYHPTCPGIYYSQPAEVGIISSFFS